MIEVRRNSIVIRNVDLESAAFKKVRYNFSIYDKVQHKYTFSVYTLIEEDLYFPATIPVETFKQYFPDKDIIENYKTTSKSRNISYNMKHLPRDELQTKAISFLMDMKNTKSSKTRFLSLETGKGKTYISINTISQLKKCPMIIVDTVDLAEQWKKEFINHTDLKDSDVVILSGAESVSNEMKQPTGKVYIAIHRTLNNMLSADNNSINILMNKLGIGIRIFDESHVNFGNICKINSLSNVEYTIYLTATPNRSNFNDDNLYGKVFRNVKFFNGKSISNEKYHTVILYPMNTHPTVEERLAIRTKYGFSQAKWAKYIANNGYDEFFETIFNVFEKFKFHEKKLKTVIMLPTIELIKKLKKDLSEALGGIEIGTYIGEIKKDKREDELSKDIILTDEKIFGKAMNLDDLEVLINCIPTGSAVITEQIIGRLRYKESKHSILVDISDHGFDECVRQFKLRRRFYKKKANKIINIIEK